MNTYATALEYARTLGAEHGANAAEWWLQDTIGGRARGGTDWRSSAEANARTILRGIDDGDPAVLDSLPAPDLSGQWADSLTGPQLFDDALRAAGDDTLRAGMTVYGDVMDAYETAFYEASQDAIVTACKAVLA